MDEEEERDVLESSFMGDDLDLEDDAGVVVDDDKEDDPDDRFH
jgi:hypothetical protein